MAFNVGSYIKNTSKSAVNRMVDDVVSSTINGMSMGVTNLTSSISQSLLASGSSYTTVNTLASLKADSVISGASNEYFAFAGKEINRTAGAAISDLRRTGSTTLSSHLLGIQPETKIAANKRKDQFETMSIV